MAVRDNDATDAAQTEETAATEEAPEVETEQVAATTEADPPTEETTEETDPEGDDEQEATEDEYDIRSYSRDLLGDDAKAWLGTFKSDEDLIKSAWETKQLVGRRNQDSEFVRNLQSLGVTAQDIQQLVAARSDKSSETTPADVEWDPSWITVDETGKWIPTAKGRAQMDIDGKIDRYRARLTEAMADPAKLAEMLMPHLAPNLDKSAKDSKAEIEARIAADRNQREFDDWQREKKEVLFAGESFTPLGKRVKEILDSGDINPGLSFREQADKAFKWAMAESRTAASPKKPVSPKAKHQIPQAPGKKSTLTDEEFFKKYGTSLAPFAKWKATGELPS